ncbi:MAG: AAC(3) family N-acetyltransferase [Halioglobus sp.]|nr:AAC(3) family N-acetyltransferase [Halioglobus sp.]
MVSLVEGASSVLLRVLPRGLFLKIRTAWLKARKRAAPLMRLIYGNFTTAQLIADIDAHLDRDWDILMVHSSVNNLSPLHDGNAMELLKALMEYVGPDRTLVMPAFNFGDDGEGARDMLRRTGRLDLRRAPSQMGLMTELFRRSRGVVQSRHPISRVAAIGPRAADLVAGHDRTPSGMGPGSPFDYMARHNAQILGIGKSFQVMTQVHHVESLLADDWPAPTITLPPSRNCRRQRRGDRAVTRRSSAAVAIQYLEAARHHVGRATARVALSPLHNVCGASGRSYRSTGECRKARGYTVRPLSDIRHILRHYRALSNRPPSGSPT